ncbi:MAG: FHA domain-containing protein [Deltaproteobacteria bacterium]|nr:FHA domain-containing protein [Deltaproteobacteria bacterium]
MGGERSGQGSGRPGRNTTFSVEAYESEPGVDPLRPGDLLDSEVTGGAATVDPNIDGFHQPTAMFDKGQFLGELADLEESAKETRAKVEAEPVAPRGLKLIIVDGPDLGMEWAFKVPEVTLGRDEDCELMMSDIAVSRRHARVVLEGAEYVLYDLDSGNGTYLNGVKVRREPLSPGDEITVGERTFRFVELTEAPATAAAHPIAGASPEPALGDPLAGEDDFAPLGGVSQLDVGVVVPEPGVNLADPSDAPPSKGPRQGEALRKVAIGIGAVALLAALGVGGFFAYRRWWAGESPAEKLARAKREFLVGVELVKAERCGDAILMFDRVLALRPEYARATQYRAHCEAEVSRWHELERARGLAGEGRIIEALEVLEKIPPESSYADDASTLASSYRQRLAAGLIADARTEWTSNNDAEAALGLIARALELVPGYRPALELKERIEGAEAPKVEVAPKPARPTIPPQLVRAIALYKNEKVSAAIDAAEAAGGDRAQEYIAQMEQVKRLLADASRAHHAKAAGELLRIVPAALDLDKRIAGGDGKVRERLDRYYANALYLKGIEAYQERDDLQAYQLLGQALRVDPSHKLAKNRYAELKSRVDQLYYEAYVQKDTNPEETKKVFRRIVKYVESSHPAHQKAKKWLRANGG